MTTPVYYECHKHGVVLGNDCPQCRVTCFMPLGVSTSGGESLTTETSKPIIERTLCILKPSVHRESITTDLLNSDFVLRRSKYVLLTAPQVEVFYAEHRGKPFFDDLVKFMSRSYLHVMILEKANAVASFRKLIGPADAAVKGIEGTLRYKYGSREVVMHNAIHGSDSRASAQREIAFFFAGYELV